MINRVVLVGRLTKDVDLRYTKSNTPVGQFTLAINRTFTNAQGEREADFINCVIWRKAAENFSHFTNKGSLVGVDGRLQSRSYENQQGQRVYVTEVVVDNFSLLESRAESEKRSSDSSNSNNNLGGNNSSNNNSNPNQAPYNNQQSQSNQSNNNSNNSNNMGDPFADNSRPIDISDDDLPF